MIEIRHRHTLNVIHKVHGDTLRGADLSGADLRGACLSGADLSWADLAGADLRGADLSWADLPGADLSLADLDVADLRGADLRGANLCGADLREADLREADLHGADLRGADLRGADLRGAKGLPEIPTVERLHKRIEEVTRAAGALDMGCWHTCETTHCRAGWAIHLAGEAGYALEKRLGPGVAGALIYHASTGMVPNFGASNKDAREDIERCAGVGGA